MNRSLILVFFAMMLAWMSGSDAFAAEAPADSTHAPTPDCVSAAPPDRTTYFTAIDRPADSEDKPSPEEPKPFYLQGDEKIIFYGDSITQAGLYIEYIDAFLATRFPEADFTIINHGISSETISGTSELDHQPRRPDAKLRFERDIAACNPNVVVACFGMNDGNYFPPNDEKYESYRIGINWLIDQIAETTNARLTLLTPPPFDPYQRRASDPEATAFGYKYPAVNYDDTLAIYADFLISLADDNLAVVDLHTAMSEHLDARRAEKVSFFLSPDAIHPNPTGHWLMAMQLLLGWNAPAVCDSIDIDMTGPAPVIQTQSPPNLHGKPKPELITSPENEPPAIKAEIPKTSTPVNPSIASTTTDNPTQTPPSGTIQLPLAASETMATKKPTARILDSGDMGVKFVWRPHLPMPIDARWDMQSIMLEKTSQRLNQHRIAIHGFDPATEYIMFADTESESKPVAKIKGAALDRGIDLTLIPEFPTTKRSIEVLELIRKRSKLEYTAWRNCIAETQNTSPDDDATTLDEIKSEIDSINTQIKELCCPAEITIRIVKGFTTPE